MLLKLVKLLQIIALLVEFHIVFKKRKWKCPSSELVSIWKLRKLVDSCHPFRNCPDLCVCICKSGEETTCQTVANNNAVPRNSRTKYLEYDF